MDNYGTIAGADAYHAARGNTAWTGSDPLKLAALTRASSYIDGHYRATDCGSQRSLFSGTKLGGRSQTLEWPRTGAYDADGQLIDETVPREIEYATYEAALRELVAPGSLSPDYIATQQVIREKIGPIDIEYSDGTKSGGTTPIAPVISLIDGMLAPLLTARNCGPAIYVV